MTSSKQVFFSYNITECHSWHNFQSMHCTTQYEIQYLCIISVKFYMQDLAINNKYIHEDACKDSAGGNRHEGHYVWTVWPFSWVIKVMLLTSLNQTTTNNILSRWLWGITLSISHCLFHWPLNNDTFNNDFSNLVWPTKCSGLTAGCTWSWKYHCCNKLAMMFTNTGTRQPQYYDPDWYGKSLNPKHDLTTYVPSKHPVCLLLVLIFNFKHFTVRKITCLKSFFLKLKLQTCTKHFKLSTL